MRIIKSSDILEALGYDYILKESPFEEPELSEFSFLDIIPEFGYHPELSELARYKLYKHQLETYLALCNGENVILISGTGSGKTEAWMIYALSKAKKTLAIYPNLALSSDQIRRIKKYSSALGLNAVELSKEKAQLWGSSLPKGTLIVVTNPAYFMTEVKRNGKILKKFFRELDLVVLDELDYYGSSKAALLLKLIELLAKYITNKKPQIVILTATLENAREIGDIITKINGRPTKIITGKPLKTRNIIYIILGKKKYIEELWENIQNLEDTEIKEKANNIEQFRNNIFDIIIKLRQKYPPQKFWSIVPPKFFEIEISELLAKYLEEKERGVTVVFTNTIASAEKHARKLIKTCKEKNIENCDEIIATHHSLISKIQREIIEEKARRGEIRIIFSPRTLEQGIDIGTIMRVIHLGLPREVRQFMQREGRKGRRKEIPFTETIIIPIRDFDMAILRNGFKSLEEWLNLGAEHLFVDTDNKYLKLLEALYKLFRKYTDKITQEEYELLKQFNLIELYPELKPTKNARTTWIKMQFYTYDLPITVPREIIIGKRRVILENIPRRMLTEKFQLGYIDPQSDGIVINVGSPLMPLIKEVYIKHMIIHAIKNKAKWLLRAYQKYRSIKAMWKETQNITADYEEGYLEAKPLVCPAVPDGFGIVTYIPTGVVWLLESRTPQPIKIEDKIIFMKVIARINVSLFITPQIKSRDFTYGYKLTINETPEITNAAMALILAILRIKHKISPNELSYYAYGKENSTLIIWENQPTNILQKLPYQTLKQQIQRTEITEQIRILVFTIDKEAHQTLLTENQQKIKETAKQVIGELKTKIKKSHKYNEKSLL